MWQPEALKPSYLLAVVEEEQRGIPSHAVLGADFVVLRAVHLDC